MAETKDVKNEIKCIQGNFKSNSGPRDTVELEECWCIPNSKFETRMEITHLYETYNIPNIFYILET